jgi:hypothetical protein
MFMVSFGLLAADDSGIGVVAVSHVPPTTKAD